MITAVALLAGSLAVTPPPMPRREVAQPAEPPPGRIVALGEREGQYTLYLPEGFVAGETFGLTIHFHTVAWFAIAEHRRRGLSEPLLVVVLGSLSGPYAEPFRDPGHFGRLLERVGETAGGRVERVSISSFSAGYGAVREILKSAEYTALIDRLVLCDSLYAGFAPDSTAANPEHLAPFIPFCQAAARGEKSFCLTYSRVPTETYANTAACAAGLAAAVGVAIEPVERGALPATLDPDFPLLERADRGRFHLWGYAGDDAPAHLTHIRHLADVWLALDNG